MFASLTIRHLPDISYRPMFASPTQPAFTGYFVQTDVRVSYPTGIYRIFQTDRCSRLLPNRHLPDISYRRDARVSYPTGIYRIFRTDAMLASPTPSQFTLYFVSDAMFASPTPSQFTLYFVSDAMFASQAKLY
jgi:hypothetical protein